MIAGINLGSYARDIEFFDDMPRAYRKALKALLGAREVRVLTFRGDSNGVETVVARVDGTKGIYIFNNVF